MLRPPVFPLLCFSVQYNRTCATLSAHSPQECFGAPSVVTFSVGAFAPFRFLGLSFPFRRRILSFALQGVPLCSPAPLSPFLCRSPGRHRFFPPLLPSRRI